jgi:hypothetical protein
MKSKKITRASSRVAKKRLLNYASWLPIRKQKEVSKLLSKNDILSATRSMYNKGNTSIRNIISPFYFQRNSKYNSTKNRILSTRPSSNRRTVNKVLKTAMSKKIIVNIVDPFTRNTSKKRGGVNPEYVQNAIKNANIRYATVGANGKLNALALIKSPTPNSRYVNVIGAHQGYGHSLMNRIINNAKTNGIKRINLKAVTHVTKNSNANNDPLVKWYKGKGFVRSGKLNKEQLLPMSIRLKTN